MPGDTFLPLRPDQKLNSDAWFRVSCVVQILVIGFVIFLDFGIFECVA